MSSEDLTTNGAIELLYGYQEKEEVVGAGKESFGETNSQRTGDDWRLIVRNGFGPQGRPFSARMTTANVRRK